MGDADVTAGAGATVNKLLPVPVDPSGLFTVKLCAPSAAEAPTVTGTVTVEEFIKVTGPSVIFAS